MTSVFTQIIFVALGGMLGASLRFVLGELILTNYTNFSFLRIFIINILGSALFGFSLSYLENFSPNNLALRALVLSGILGSFTTFSTFSYDNLNLYLESKIILLFFNMFAQVFLSVIFLYLFLYLGQILFKN